MIKALENLDFYCRIKHIEETACASEPVSVRLLRYVDALTHGCICIMYACGTHIWECRPICVTHSCAAPAVDVPLSPSLLPHSIKVTSLCSPKGARRPPSRTDNTAEHIHAAGFLQYGDAKGMRYSMLLQSPILSKIKPRGNCRRHLSLQSLVWPSG